MGKGSSPPNGFGDDPFEAERLRMVEGQIRRRGVKDDQVLRAMEEVPRHAFVQPGDLASAYYDNPLPIGFGQTISQPYIVALMTEALQLAPTDRVLEIGTGSGYQSAVLSKLAGEVFTIELVEPLGKRAKRLLERMGCANVYAKIGDGFEGWREKAPFDGIIVTAAPETTPETLVEQLADGGRMVVPVGLYHQELLVLHKEGARTRRWKIADVRFVPMVSRGKTSR